MAIVKLDSKDKIDILVEVPDSFDDSSQRTGGPGEGVVSTLDGLERIGQQVAKVCTSIFGQVKRSAGGLAPDELSLQFGIKLTGKTGIPYLVEGSAEGTFQVTATWKDMNKEEVNQ